MTLLKLPRSPITLVSAIALAIVSFPSDLSLVNAQDLKPVNKTFNSKPVRLTPYPLSNKKSPDFSGDGRPGRRAGGGSRGPCPATHPPLTALTPVTNSGKTVAAHPIFWFYVPYSPQEARSGEFVLQDEEYNNVLRTPFTLPKTPGFVSFSIPSTKARLEVNKWYFWSFKLYCGSQQLSSPVFVEGWVQRIEPNPALESQLQAAKPRDYVVYTTNGIWYDAIASLASLRLTNTPSPVLDSHWADLLSLRSVGLERLRQAPVIGSVLSQPLARGSSQPIAH